MGLVVLVGLALRTAPCAIPTAAGQAAAPAGRWTTFANGDDILDLLVDGDVVWAGTRAGGLVRWDVTTGAYRQFLRPQDPLAGNIVYDLARDDGGRLWLATDGGLTCYHDQGTAAETDDFWFSYTTANGAGMPCDEIHAVAVSGDLVWIGGVQREDLATGAWSGGGLGRLDSRGTDDPTDDVWAEVTTYASTYREDPTGKVFLGLVSDSINDLLVTPKGNLWVATTYHRLLQEAADPSAPATWQRVHGGISFLDTAGTADPGDDVWTGNSCELLELTVTCTVHRLALDHRGRAWAADGGRGIIHFDPDRGDLLGSPNSRFVPPEAEGDSFVTDLAFGPADDPVLDDTIWLATRSGGVTVLNHQGTLVDRSDDVWNLGRGAAFTPTDGLARARAQAVALGDGRMWVGSGPERGSAGGLQAISLADQSVAPAWRTERAPPANFITDLVFGAAGTRWADHVWLGTGGHEGASATRLFGAGAVDLDTRGTAATADDVWTVHTTRGTDDNGAAPWTGLVGDNVQAVTVRGDEVWLGSAQTQWDREAGSYVDGGVAVFDGTRWTARRPVAGAAQSLGSGGVASLAVGCADELWVGTGNPWDHDGTGVYVLPAGSAIHDPSADSWTRYRYPQHVAAANTSAIAVDCAAGKVWVASTHHVNTADTGGALGQWGGGGVAVLDMADGLWTRYTGRDGLETFAAAGIAAEVLAVEPGPGGTAWAGTLGRRAMSEGDLVALRPYWPAALNRWDGSAWSSEVFEQAGMVTGVARDASERLWVATSRGGMAYDSGNPDNWQADRDVGGLYVQDGGSWIRLTAALSGIPANDISVVRVAPDGTVWLGTQGWGLARFEPGATGGTATPTVRLPTRTPSPTSGGSETTPTTRPASPTPTGPTVRPPSATPTRPGTGTAVGPLKTIHLPFSTTFGHPRRPPLDERIWLPTAMRRR